MLRGKTPKGSDFFLTNQDDSFDEFIANEENKKGGFLKSIFNFRFLNLLLVSFSFFLLFSAYNITYNFLTSVHEDVGYLTLAILTFFFSIGNLIVPTIIQIFGSKICVPVALLIYSMFLLISAIPTPRTKNGFFNDFGNGIYQIYKCFESNGDTSQVHVTTQQCLGEKGLEFIYANYPALIFFSYAPILGFGGALVWASSAAYVTAVAYDPVTEKTENGFYSGVFFSIYQANLIVGNIALVILLYFQFNVYYIFLGLWFVAISGFLLGLTLWPYNNKNKANQKNGSNDKKLKSVGAVKSLYTDIDSDSSITPRAPIEIPKLNGLAGKILEKVISKFFGVLHDTKDGLLSTFSVIFDKRMLMMAPICIYAGMSASYFYGALPNATRDPIWIALEFLSFGFAEFFGSVVSGKLNDVLGKRLMLYCTILIHAISIILSLQPIFFLTGRIVLVGYDEVSGAPKYQTEGNPATILISYFFWGLADAAMNTSLYSIIPAKSMFANEKAPAGFAAMKLFMCFASSSMFVAGMFFKDLMVVQQILLGVLLLLGTGFCVLLEVLFVSFDERKKKTVDDEEANGGKGIFGKIVFYKDRALSFLNIFPLFGKKI